MTSGVLSAIYPRTKKVAFTLKPVEEAEDLFEID
jgi:hypothetical protein